MDSYKQVGNRSLAQMNRDNAQRYNDSKLSASDPNAFVVRWEEFTKSGSTTKEAGFNSEQERETFANQLENKESFKEFSAWSDPK